MSINRFAAVAVALALPAAGVVAPVAAAAHAKASRSHHRTSHKRPAGPSHTVSFTARVVRATSKGLVVRTARGKILSFSGGQIRHRVAPKRHRITKPHKGRAHDVNLPISVGNVVVNILGLQPGALVQITETIGSDGTITVTISLPAPPVQQTEQTVSGVVTDLGSDTFTVQTSDDTDLRLHMTESALSQAGLNTCDTVEVTYHQDGGLLVADSATTVGTSTAGDCAPSNDASGSITAISSDSVTLATDQGALTVAVDPASGLTDGFQIGDVVDVTYTQSSDGSLLASDICYVEEDTSGQVVDTVGEDG